MAYRGLEQSFREHHLFRLSDGLDIERLNLALVLARNNTITNSDIEVRSPYLLVDDVEHEVKSSNDCHNYMLNEALGRAPNELERQLFLADPFRILQGLGFEPTRLPQKLDIIIYSGVGKSGKRKARHSGVVQMVRSAAYGLDGKQEILIRSKFGRRGIFIHPVDYVPSPYEGDIDFFRKHN